LSEATALVEMARNLFEQSIERVRSNIA